MQEYNNGTVQDSATKKHSDNNKAPVETKSEPSVETKSQLGKTSPFTGTGNSLFSNSSLGKTTSSSLFSAQPSPNSFGEKPVLLAVLAALQILLKQQDFRLVSILHL